MDCGNAFSGKKRPGEDGGAMLHARVSMLYSPQIVLVNDDEASEACLRKRDACHPDVGQTLEYRLHLLGLSRTRYLSNFPPKSFGDSELLSC